MSFIFIGFRKTARFIERAKYSPFRYLNQVQSQDENQDEKLLSILVALTGDVGVPGFNLPGAFDGLRPVQPMGAEFGRITTWQVQGR